MHVRHLRTLGTLPTLGSDHADADRAAFLERERRKHDAADLIKRYDWRAWLRDMRDAAITLILFGVALGVLDALLELLQ